MSLERHKIPTLCSIRYSIVAGVAPRADAPIPAELNLDDWWPANTEAHVRVFDRAREVNELWSLNAGAAPRPLFIELASQRPNEVERGLDVGVRTRAIDATGAPVGDGAWSNEHVVRIVVPLSPPLTLPTLTPVRNDAMDAMVDSVFEQGVIRWETGPRPVAFWFDLQRTSGADFDGIVFGVEIDLREGDAIRRTLRAWWIGGPRGVSWRAEIAYEDTDALWRLPADGAGWSVRVRGSEEIALRALVPRPRRAGAMPPPTPVATSYWSGDRTMPAHVTTRPLEAPPRRWVRPQT